VTTFIDIHIPIFPDPTHPGRNAALHYVAHVAWPQPGEQEKRDRFVSALLAAHYKAARRNIPKTLPIKPKVIGAISRDGLKRIYERRLPALRMLMQRFMRAGAIDPPPWLTPEQQTRLLKLNQTAALLDPHGDLLGKEGTLLDERNLYNIRRDIWRDSRPALAMVHGLWSVGAFGRNGRPLLSLIMGDPRWVPEAVAEARMMAVAIEHTINPPILLVPRRVLVPERGDRLLVEPRRFLPLLLPALRRGRVA
jgi:hypothetical protein